MRQHILTDRYMRFLYRIGFIALVVLTCFNSCSSEYKVIPPESEYLDYLLQIQSDQSYVIGHGDLLSVRVWKHDTLSAEVTVRPDGYISLPLIGDVLATGLTVDELKDNIDKRMREYIKEPSVSICVTQINSLKIYILGEVSRPGAYDLSMHTDVLQAIALAGGFTAYAKKNEIQVIRTQNNVNIKFEFNYNQVVRGKNLQQNIALMPGDVIIVP